jgi:hypothetical protein
VQMEDIKACTNNIFNRLLCPFFGKSRSNYLNSVTKLPLFPVLFTITSLSLSHPRCPYSSILQASTNLALLAMKHNANYSSMTSRIILLAEQSTERASNSKCNIVMSRNIPQFPNIVLIVISRCIQSKNFNFNWVKMKVFEKSDTNKCPKYVQNRTIFGYWTVNNTYIYDTLLCLFLCCVQVSPRPNIKFNVIMHWFLIELNTICWLVVWWRRSFYY